LCWWAGRLLSTLSGVSGSVFLHLPPSPVTALGKLSGFIMPDSKYPYICSVGFQLPCNSPAILGRHTPAAPSSELPHHCPAPGPDHCSRLLVSLGPSTCTSSCCNDSKPPSSRSRQGLRHRPWCWAELPCPIALHPVTRRHLQLLECLATSPAFAGPQNLWGGEMWPVPCHALPVHPARTDQQRGVC